MITVNVITRDNGAGLSVDLKIVTAALIATGFEITVTALGHRSRGIGKLRYRWSRVRHRWQRLAFETPRYRHDINLMLERVYPEMFTDARHNVLVPNPEWFRDEWKCWLPQFDRILVKTRHAATIFNGLGCKTRYIGFTSRDQRLPHVLRCAQFLHLPGRSNNKGTQALLQLWRENPHWPRLTTVWRSRDANVDPVPDNVEWIRDCIDDHTLQQLQNAHAFHLCPSETEGYGHYLAEALGVGAVTVTVEAPPMNELVTPDRGVLCAAHPKGKQALATLYQFDGANMRAAVERCIDMGEEERLAIGVNARSWFEETQRTFPARLRGALLEFA